MSLLNDVVWKDCRNVYPVLLERLLYSALIYLNLTTTIFKTRIKLSSFKTIIFNAESLHPKIYLYRLKHPDLSITFLELLI